MDEIPFYQKPWFTSLVLAILLLGVYIANIVWQGGLFENLPGVIFDVIILVLLFLFCVFFYAQFILPLRNWKDRLKIWDRLWLHASKGHGPAIFIKNGRKVESAGESEKKGPGVLWIDTASASATRNDKAFKNFFGPGVHFTDSDEKIAGNVISLHIQTHSIGPNKDEDPFAKPKENPSEEEQKKYRETHTRYIQVRAITRDGIEIVPNISVTFKIDAKPARLGEKGSRFGFEEEIIGKVARSEAISASSSSEERKHVAWNQLPALMAADLWREYLSKFTLNELFTANIESLPEVPQPEPSSPKKEKSESEPPKSNVFSNILRYINDSFEHRLEKLVAEDKLKEKPAEPLAIEKAEVKKKPAESKPQTALQMIVQIMKTRMTQANVAKLDESGRLLDDFESSKEYKTLKERGINVISVGVSNLRLSPAYETQLLQHWNTNWLANAKADRNRIDRLNFVYTENGRQKAVQDYALALSQTLKENPRDIPSAVRALLERAKSEIASNDRLLRRTTNEAQSLEDIINWTESKEL